MVVALSGGVDSAVCAYLLKKQGYQVSGIYMRNWSEADEAYCSGADDLESVDKVAHFLDIPYKVVDFQKEYWNHVFEPVLDAYQSGVTPNPDVLCNKEIKFKSLTDFVFSRDPRPDYLATGHYAQIKRDPKVSDRVNLCEAEDANKDQTYFLLQVEQKSFHRVLFPIGHLTKPQVREIAIEANLPNAQRKESVGLCFVGKRKFDDFIGEFTERPGTRPGAILKLETGETVGVHKGALFYTIGQAANISGAPARMFVVSKNLSANTVTVCEGSHHPALYKDSLVATGINWISGYTPQALLEPNGVLKCFARIRHRQELKACSVTLVKNTNDTTRIENLKQDSMLEKSGKSDSKIQNSKTQNKPKSDADEEEKSLDAELDASVINVTFDAPLRAISEGQYIGLYLDGVCLGGGVISSTGANYHEQNKAVEVTLREKSMSNRKVKTSAPSPQL